MAESEDGRSTLPIRAIHEAYRDALTARREYRQAVGGPLESDAHHRLQEAVASYYDVLRPLMESANSTEKLWEEAELWPTEPKYQSVNICPGCNSYVPVESAHTDAFPLGGRCPECGDEQIGRDQIPKLDDEGRVEYHHVEGLQSVEGIFDQQVEREVEYSDALGTNSETVVETRLVPSEHLQLIAEKLDKVMERLSLHAEVDDEVPTTELDKEDLEDFQERLVEIREEWADEDGLTDSEVAE